MAQSSSSSSSSSASLLGVHLWKHCTTVARKKLEMMAAMDTATPEKMMMNRSVSERLNLHSLKLASDSSWRDTLLFSKGREHWISSRPGRRRAERETGLGYSQGLPTTGQGRACRMQSGSRPQNQNGGEVDWHGIEAFLKSLRTTTTGDSRMRQASLASSGAWCSGC